MNMFKSYSHIRKPIFLMILAWLCRFKMDTSQTEIFDKLSVYHNPLINDSTGNAL